VNIARKWALRLPKSGKQTALPSSHTRLAALKCFSWAKMSGTPRRFADQLEHHRRGNNLHTQSFESAAAQRDRAHRLPRLGRGEDASEVERSRRLYRAYSGNGGLGGALVAGKACRIVVSPLTRLPFMRLSRVIRILPLLLAIAASYRAALGEGAPDYLPPPFGCEVRYVFRETIPGTSFGEKTRSAPDHLTQPLPGPRWQTGPKGATRYVMGKLPTLGFAVRVAATRIDGNDPGELTVGVTRTSDGRPIAGFPRRFSNALAQLRESLVMEIPVTKEQRAAFSKKKLKTGQQLTAVLLLIGAEIEPDYGQ